MKPETATLLDRAADLWPLKMPLADLAGRLGCSRMTIKAAVSRARLKGDPRFPTMVPARDPLPQEVIDLYLKTRSLRLTAAPYGRCRNVLARQLVEAGIDVRHEKGEPPKKKPPVKATVPKAAPVAPPVRVDVVAEVPPPPAPSKRDIIAEAVAAGKVRRCPPAFAYGAVFMGEPPALGEVPPLLKPVFNKIVYGGSRRERIVPSPRA